MNTGELIIALILFCIAGALVFVYRQQRAKLALMAATPNFTTAELEDVRKNPILASGSAFPFLAEVNGVVECDAPLTAQLSGEQCVAFRLEVQREWEEQKQVRASDGSTRTETTSHTETVSELHRETRFVLRDRSGTIEIDPDGCDIDMPQVFDRFEPSSDGNVQVQFGGFSFNVASGFGGAGTRTKGYRAKEWALRAGQPVYVMGEVREQGDRLMVARPTARGELFLISTKSEKELAAAAKTGMWLALGGAIVLAAAGLGLLVHALLGG